MIVIQFLFEQALRWSNSPTHPCYSSFVLIAGYNPFFYSEPDDMRCGDFHKRQKLRWIQVLKRGKDAQVLSPTVYDLVILKGSRD